LGVVLMAGPAFAQSLTATDERGSADQLEHGEASRQAGGFRLVEHGAWQRVEVPGAPALPPNEVGRVHLPYHYPQTDRRGPSDFRRASFLSHVEAAEARHALPPGLLDALVWTESRYNPGAVSKAGAAGLGQLMPGTARDLGIANRFDPVANLDGAARYLRQMLDKFGVVHLALAAYNAGPGAVERARGIPRNGETPAYVRNVLRYWQLVTGDR
jgi:hypothetical protein